MGVGAAGKDATRRSEVSPCSVSGGLVSDKLGCNLFGQITEG